MRRSSALLGLAVLIPAAFAQSPADVILDWGFEDGIPGTAVTLATDSSGAGNHGRIRIGNPIYVDSGPDAEPGQRSMQVSGTGTGGSAMVAAESSTLNLASAASFTVEAIFRPSGDNRNANRTLIQRSDAATLIWSYGLYYDGSSKQANFGIVNQNAESVLIFAPVPDDGRFHRLAGTFKDGRLSLYVDGVLKTNLTTHIQPDPRPKQGVAVGAIFNGGFYFNGQIARVRLTRRALEPGEFLPGGKDFFDGIPTDWWKLWFGEGWATDPRAVALADPDEDGRNNSGEYKVLTNPLDPDSGFATSLRTVPRVTWRSIPGAVYRITRRDQLRSIEGTVVAPEFTASGTESTWLDETAPTDEGYYAVERIR